MYVSNRFVKLKLLAKKLIIFSWASIFQTLKVDTVGEVLHQIWSTCIVCRELCINSETEKNIMSKSVVYCKIFNEFTIL